MKVEEFDFVEYHNQSIDYDCLDGYGVIVYSNQVTYFDSFKTIHIFKNQLDCLSYAFKLLHHRPFDLCKISGNEVILF